MRQIRHICAHSCDISKHVKLFHFLIIWEKYPDTFMRLHNMGNYPEVQTTTWQKLVNTCSSLQAPHTYRSLVSNIKHTMHILPGIYEYELKWYARYHSVSESINKSWIFQHSVSEVSVIGILTHINSEERSEWLRGLMQEQPSPTQTLPSWVRIPL